ncbi:MAG TPA: type II toxin-antitoxin system RelE/ParE family toxin [Rhabdochlamydiaceae bacterium]|nr:type II toxin-antitoxin system RelE/ParE family toxin [Rhabdochlamydiaceae bacterium]
MKYRVKETDEYVKWFNKEPKKSKQQIIKRVVKIRDEGHFGHINDSLGEGLSELKFNDGRRIYYIILHLPIDAVILLLGGNKNGQTQDIKKAKSILRKISKNGP